MGLSIFQCEECGTVDLDLTPDGSATICTACKTGEWHGVFEREDYNPEQHGSIEDDDSY